MRAWIAPNAVGLILFVFFLAFQALCGSTNVRPGQIIVENWGDPLPQVTTFGFPTLLELDDGPPPAVTVHWLRLIAVLAAAWAATMALGRLTLDGGATPAAAMLLPPRRHPAILLLAYLAAVPVLAAPGLLFDMKFAGLRGLGSPDGPSAYPLFVLGLGVYGLPVVAIILALRRVLDRRRAAQLFQTDAPPAPEIEWPFP